MRSALANDVLIQSKKCAGILTELDSSTHPSAIIAGIGINVNHSSFPAELSGIATSLRLASGCIHSRERLLVALLGSVDTCCDLLEKEGRGPIIEAFTHASSFVSGRRVCVDQDGFELRGTTAGLNDSGFLILRDDTLFQQALEKINQRGIVPATHVANSAALITYYPQSKGTWVRPGIALYGVYPNPRMKNRVKLIPVMQVKTRVLHTKTLEKGQSVSYGRTYKAKKKIKVATLGMGYADGLFRALSNKGHCLIRGIKVPLIGTVCMDMTMADVTHVTGVKVGDVATFFGRDGKILLPVEEQAALAGTISYELFCAVGERVSRIYLK